MRNRTLMPRCWCKGWQSDLGPILLLFLQICPCLTFPGWTGHDPEKWSTMRTSRSSGTRREPLYVLLSSYLWTSKKNMMTKSDHPASAAAFRSTDMCWLRVIYHTAEICWEAVLSIEFFFHLQVFSRCWVCVGLIVFPHRVFHEILGALPGRLDQRLLLQHRNQTWYQRSMVWSCFLWFLFSRLGLGICGCLSCTIIYSRLRSPISSIPSGMSPLLIITVVLLLLVLLLYHWHSWYSAWCRRFHLLWC